MEQGLDLCGRLGGHAGNIQSCLLVGHGFKNNPILNLKGHQCFAVVK